MWIRPKEDSWFYDTNAVTPPSVYIFISLVGWETFGQEYKKNKIFLYIFLLWTHFVCTKSFTFFQKHFFFQPGKAGGFVYKLCHATFSVRNFEGFMNTLLMVMFRFYPFKIIQNIKKIWEKGSNNIFILCKFRWRSSIVFVESRQRVKASMKNNLHKTLITM